MLSNGGGHSATVAGKDMRAWDASRLESQVFFLLFIIAILMSINKGKFCTNGIYKGADWDNMGLTATISTRARDVMHLEPPVLGMDMPIYMIISGAIWI